MKSLAEMTAAEVKGLTQQQLDEVLKAASPRYKGASSLARVTLEDLRRYEASFARWAEDKQLPSVEMMLLLEVRRDRGFDTL